MCCSVATLTAMALEAQGITPDRGELLVTGASGGVGTLDHLVEGVREGGASAVLAASIFHFGTQTIGAAKAHMHAAGIPVRMDA